MEFLAKSHPRETLRQHTDKVLQKLERIFTLYGDHFTVNEKDLLRIACEYHDYGKIEQVFQLAVRGERRSIEMPHGFLSGLFLWDAKHSDLQNAYSEEEIRALYTAIHYHHTRSDDKSEAAYRQYAIDHLKENYEVSTGRHFSANFRYLRKRLFVNNPAATHGGIDEQAYLKYLLIKGILNKADYAASADTEVEIEAREQLTNSVLLQFGDRLRPTQLFMQTHNNENIIAIAPTGSGKTEGAILWLNNNKGFYTLPLKVSASAIYHRIYDKPQDTHSRGYGFVDVGLLHSDSISEYINDSEINTFDTDDDISERKTLAEYRSVKNLAFPLTITTVDQLFKFVFNALGTEIFAATLKYSRVVIDEMQMYNPAILAMLIYGLKTISRMGGKFAIITATLPDFVRNKLQQENVPFAYNVFTNDDQRHIVKIQPPEFADSFDLDAIRESAKTEKVLVICNTVRKAQELKKLLSEARLLHSRFIKEERDHLEKEIIDFQDKKKHPDSVGIWISTQLVEASLDIDFDVLHTELCTADSLLQRMGRCWRSRTYLLLIPNIFIYDHGPSGIYDKDIYDRSKKILEQYEGKIFTEQDKLNYINAVFYEPEIRDSEYYRNFQKRWTEIQDIPPTMYSKDEADKLFRHISSVNVIPDSIYNQYQDEIIDRITIINNKKASLEERYKARQKLNRLTISINPYSGDGKTVDKKPISGTDIYRTCAIYSSIYGSAEGHESGLGLLREELSDDNFI